MHVCEQCYVYDVSIKAICINRSPINQSRVEIHTPLNNRLNINGNNLVMLQALTKLHTLHHMLFLLSSSSHLRIVFQSILAPVCPACGTRNQTELQPRLFSKGPHERTNSGITTTPTIIYAHIRFPSCAGKCHTQTSDKPVCTVLYTIYNDTYRRCSRSFPPYLFSRLATLRDTSLRSCQELSLPVKNWHPCNESFSTNSSSLYFTTILTNHTQQHL